MSLKIIKESYYLIRDIYAFFKSNQERYKICTDLETKRDTTSRGSNLHITKLNFGLKCNCGKIGMLHFLNIYSTFYKGIFFYKSNKKFIIYIY